MVSIKDGTNSEASLFGALSSRNPGVSTPSALKSAAMSPEAAASNGVGISHTHLESSSLVTRSGSFDFLGIYSKLTSG